MDPALRRSIYRIMMVVTLAAATARIASAERVYEASLHAPPAGEVEVDPPLRVWPATRPQPMPTFSSNDRSRWATIRALVEDGTFVIGKRNKQADGSYTDSGRIFEPGYESVDKVMDPKTGLFYSSKPPLYTVLVAGEYWLLHKCGLTLEHDRWLVVRVIVWTQNIVPLAILLLALVPVLERHGRTDWGRLFTFATACFGTFLTTFAITLNNHVPAAVSAFLAVQPLLIGDRFSIGKLAFCGLMAGMAFCLELPALALLAGLFVGLLWRFPRPTLLGFLPAALLPVAAQLELNYLAIGEVLPAYSKLDGADKEWYLYKGSHWRTKPGEVKKGIDFISNEPRAVYAAHLLIGHHGLFSLTPVWLLALPPLVSSFRVRRHPPGAERTYDELLLLVALSSFAMIVFFCAIVGTHNYGGWTNGPRWFFWLAPLWLLPLLRSADWLAASAPRRALGLLCLAISVFSASYSPWNPWRHPWLYNWMESMGWISYGK